MRLQNCFQGDRAFGGLRKEGQDTGPGDRKPEFESCGRRQMCSPVASAFSGVKGAAGPF